MLNWFLEYNDILDEYYEVAIKKSIILETVLIRERELVVRISRKLDYNNKVRINFTVTERRGGLNRIIAKYCDYIAKKMWINYCEEFKSRGET